MCHPNTFERAFVQFQHDDLDNQDLEALWFLRGLQGIFYRRIGRVDEGKHFARESFFNLRKLNDPQALCCDDHACLDRRGVALLIAQPSQGAGQAGDR